MGENMGKHLVKEIISNFDWKPIYMKKVSGDELL